MAGRSFFSWLFGSKTANDVGGAETAVAGAASTATGPEHIFPAGSHFTRPHGREDRAGDPPDTVRVPFDFAIAAGSEAGAALETLAALRPGATPVILGGPREAGLAMELFQAKDPDPPGEALARATSLDVEHWLATRYDGLNLGSDLEDEPPRGDWPEDVEPTLDIGATTRYDAATQSMVWQDQVIIVLVPTDDASAVPAFLQYGNWNDCPPPELHVAIARRWHEAYGARIVVCGADTIEMRVARPITTRDEAMAVALLQYRYCSDIVDQGVGTIEALAASLMGSTVWYFWWD